MINTNSDVAYAQQYITSTIESFPMASWLPMQNTKNNSNNDNSILSTLVTATAKA
jgi:hypothetical protein